MVADVTLAGWLFQPCPVKILQRFWLSTLDILPSTHSLELPSSNASFLPNLRPQWFHYGLD